MKQNKSIQSVNRTARTKRTGAAVRVKSQVTQTIQLAIEPARCEIIQTDSKGKHVATVGANGAICPASGRLVRESAMRRGAAPQPEIELAYSLFRKFEGCEPVQKVCSYRLKHLAERHLKTYLSNGSAIIASAMAGFWQDFDPQSTNSTVRCPVALLREMGERTQRKPAGCVPVVVVMQPAQPGV